MPGVIMMQWFGNLIFHPMSLMENFTYRICRDRADRQWPKVVQERRESDGPTTRLDDIEADYDRTEQLQ